MLIVVDDAQWLDGSTLDALRFVAKRLGACRAALLLATREELDPAGWPRADILVVRGLERDPALALLGEEGMTAEVRERLVTATAGNPLALWEMPAQLTDAQRSGREPLADPLPAGASLERVYRGRVGALPDGTREALLMVAATHADALSPVAAALRARGIDVDTLAAAEAAGLVERRDDRVVFSHPLVRSAVYWGAPLPARRAAHAALAEHAEAESRAWHLAAAATAADEQVAAALEEAARAAERRGALAAATEAFERAGRLSPAGARVRRRSEGARTAVLAGRLDVARHTLDDLLTEPHDATVHADLELMRATVMLLGGEPLGAYELLVGEAGRIEPHDRPRAAALLSAAGIALLVGGHVRDLRAVAERARALAGPDADLVADRPAGRGARGGRRRRAGARAAARPRGGAAGLRRASRACAGARGHRRLRAGDPRGVAARRAPARRPHRRGPPRRRGPRAGLPARRVGRARRAPRPLEPRPAQGPRGAADRRGDEPGLRADLRDRDAGLPRRRPGPRALVPRAGRPPGARRGRVRAARRVGLQRHHLRACSTWGSGASTRPSPISSRPWPISRPGAWSTRASFLRRPT